MTPSLTLGHFPPKVQLNSHEASGSSWVFSDVCNYPVSRQCLVEDKDMHILHRLRSIEEKAWNRPLCLSVGDMVVDEKVTARLGTQPTTTDVCDYSREFQIKAIIEMNEKNKKLGGFRQTCVFPLGISTNKISGTLSQFN